MGELCRLYLYDNKALQKPVVKNKVNPLDFRQQRAIEFVTFQVGYCLWISHDYLIDLIAN